MCCMSYEKELYSELWSSLPGPGAKIKTEKGIYTLESLDVGHEQVNIRFPGGRLIPVAISEFADFKETVMKGEEWGEDKEMAEKKRKAAERIAAIKARAERLKNRGVRSRSSKPKASMPAKSPETRSPNPKPKPKSKPANADTTQKPKRRKPKKPRTNPEE